MNKNLRPPHCRSLATYCENMPDSTGETTRRPVVCVLSVYNAIFTPPSHTDCDRCRRRTSGPHRSSAFSSPRTSLSRYQNSIQWWYILPAGQNSKNLGLARRTCCGTWHHTQASSISATSTVRLREGRVHSDCRTWLIFFLSRSNAFVWPFPYIIYMWMPEMLNRKYAIFCSHFISYLLAYDIRSSTLKWNKEHPWGA